MLDEHLVALLEARNIDQVLVRSPVTCDTPLHLRQVLRPHWPWAPGERRRGGRRDRRPVDREPARS